MENIDTIAGNVMHEKKVSISLWITYGLGLVAFILTFFHRTNSTTLVPDLIDTFNVSSTSLGLLSSLYFYMYAALQPVIGFITDRLKPTKVIMFSLIIEGIGTLIYAYSPNFQIVLLGRILIGIGCAGIFVPITWMVRMYFPSNKIGFLVSMLISFGNIGSIIAASPLAFLIYHFGWRVSMEFFGLLAFTIAFLFGIFLKFENIEKKEIVQNNDRMKNKRDFLHFTLKGIKDWIIILKKIFGIPIIKYVLLTFLGYGAMMSLQALWAIPYLLDIYNLDKIVASKILTMISFGFIFGLLVLSKKFDSSCIKYFFFGANIIATLVYLLFVIYTDKLSILNLYIMFFLIGATHSFVPYTLKIYSVVFPKEIYGAGVGLVNLFPLLISALYQSFTGYMFDLFNHSEGISSLLGYKIFYIFLILSLLIASISSLKVIKIINKNYKNKL